MLECHGLEVTHKCTCTCMYQVYVVVKTPKRVIGYYRADPDQTSQNTASEYDRHSLQIV